MQSDSEQHLNTITFRYTLYCLPALTAKVLVHWDFFLILVHKIDWSFHLSSLLLYDLNEICFFCKGHRLLHLHNRGITLCHCVNIDRKQKKWDIFYNSHLNSNILFFKIYSEDHSSLPTSLALPPKCALRGLRILLWVDSFRIIDCIWHDMEEAWRIDTLQQSHDQSKWETGGSFYFSARVY